MLLIIKTSSHHKKIIADLNSIFHRIDPKVWIGWVTERIRNDVMNQLREDRSSESILGIISKSMSNSYFYEIKDGNINEINIYEIFKTDVDKKAEL